jgi:hypothetical protein
MKKIVLIVLTVSLALVMAFADEPPVRKGPPPRGPRPSAVVLKRAFESCNETARQLNLAKAQKEWDADGHAAKAQALLDQVIAELKLSIESTNK